MLLKQALYGGAITTVVPEGFLDASILREVPDTQEVYVNSREEPEKFDDGLGTNESIIFDLLQRVDETDDVKALHVHLEEISSINETNAWTILYHEQKGAVQRCIAVETVLKWGKKELSETLILCLSLIRLEDVETDIIISVNVPVNVPEELVQLKRYTDDPDGVSSLPERIQAGFHLLTAITDQFTIVDDGLFI
ncbi:Ran GTPase-binding protein MOG1 Ecym_3614 [Eremothecium cymbalariae DBVPG|uniref:Mog1p/PsbP-like protein n=1 Tax=Eremothecium cymbalariae (strain CBS 270.75 / DBVPG 7215 / KCTC 17166 / NRRL Y-17582) TaxID=931890 RepID=G8JQU1_ERECY|nr:Hypothetical protein Ecym_3614 [Eremothecium cymbalariae DBVPG\